jgi:hypothetical protein
MHSYDQDIVAWSEEQAALLRRVASGEHVNSVDWLNIIDEIEAVGSNQLHAVESLLVQAMRHRLKCLLWPHSLNAAHWQAEAQAFLGDARRRYAASMRQKIDMQALYTEACRAIPATDYGVQPETDMPAGCPWSLDEMLDQ